MAYMYLPASPGIGAPRVETVLPNPHVRPGEPVQGHVDLVGGAAPAHIGRVLLGMRTRVEAEAHGREYKAPVDTATVHLGGPFVLGPGEHRRIPFTYPLSIQAPLTFAWGHPLYGSELGLSTFVEIGGAVSATDLDPLAVHPLPAQQAVLDAVVGLGFSLIQTDMEHGRISGVHHEMPYHQEFEFRPGPNYMSRMEELELAFVAAPLGVLVVLEADKRGSLLTEGVDRLGGFQIPQQAADYRPQVQHQIETLLRGRRL
ncbi:sporulation protein [Nocardiopsis sp. RSe5-2]|uniref:Sporulation protein n=1 Tax=Nocardiopsis endophytica TaxID=3018445 RepID=A0ABT4UA98_9ACTN|nr:sporulation protein [Nocardiopsis endophytica]MDA2813409.1 sporulation protein [Nocardiopsis endophytica]